MPRSRRVGQYVPARAHYFGMLLLFGKENKMQRSAHKTYFIQLTSHGLAVCHNDEDPPPSLGHHRQFLAWAPFQIMRRQAGSSKPVSDSQGTSRSRPPSAHALRRPPAESKQRPPSSSSSSSVSAASARESAIQVYVRCAPMPADSAETACVACEPTKSTELLLSSAPAHISPTSAYYLGAAAGAAAASGTSGSTTAPDSGEEQKLYTYDACFGGHADQAMVYAEVCQPLLDKVLDGYPCTIFAVSAHCNRKLGFPAAERSRLSHSTAPPAQARPTPCKATWPRP